MLPGREWLATRGRYPMRKWWLATGIAGVAAFGLSSSQPLVAQSDVDQQLGNVHFKTSCNAAKEVFEEALKADPTCAISHWGIALSLLNNPHGPVPAPNLPLGVAAIQKAKAVGAKTEREGDYIDA